MGFLVKLGSWLIGGGIASIGEQLNKAYQTKLTAQTDQAKMEADQNIAQLEAQRAILLAEQGSWETRWIRPAFALPFVVYNAKLILWDKVLAMGTTDALSPDLIKMQTLVIGAYFLSRPVEKIGQTMVRSKIVTQAVEKVKAKTVPRRD